MERVYSRINSKPLEIKQFNQFSLIKIVKRT
ncbi:hypothetical protein CPS_0406 [Colwellia psychrerythraea 34H]|uniref:Uncharacterized protein n=1 Tax=Colwellia psychrerythraea (strain 34H / ATCC BAA-681) TaxID=167879 RepID=Q489V0_COLP3|nr:hypothetical protein CPS_0406 [Colwellia psychrerythraea 34H]